VHRWAAEVTVDEDLARRLVEEQFPELEARSLRLVAEGWDNAVWLVDERWAFRFPRREIALPGFERELAVLPKLAPLLPLPIPAPVFAGRPTDAFPWPFSGAAWLPGREAGDVLLMDGERIGLAGELGGVLKVLHSPEVAGAIAGRHELLEDPLGRADMSRRVPRTIECLAEAEELGLWRATDDVSRLLEEARELPAAPASALVHGDLHFRHLLVEDRALSGIIDWGDLCLADPSVDLQVVWSFFPPEGRSAFLDAYGPVQEEQLVCARVLALGISAVLAVYGRHEALPGVEREAAAGLERAASG
jgi:aminoglycoside phosphotransferase (APT) family kinase protein